MGEETAARLRERIAEAMREHYLSTNRDEADADGNMPCRCGWRDPGPMGSNEDDWDSHLAAAVLPLVQQAATEQTEQLREPVLKALGIDLAAGPVDLADVALTACRELQKSEAARDRLRAERDQLRAGAEQLRDRIEWQAEQHHHARERAYAETEQLRSDRDRLAKKVESLEACYGQVAADALKHRGCHMRLGGVLNRAEAAEADRDRLAAEVAELRARLAEYDRTRAAVTEGAPLGRALTASDVLVQHDVTRKALADALGTGWHLNWAQLVDAAKRSHQANTEWQRDATELRGRLADAEEGITAAVQHRKRAEDRAQRAEKRIQAVTEAAILWRDRPGGDVGLAIALASILDTEQPEPPAATAMVRVLRECDRIEREVYGQHDEDDDGKREAVRRIRTALDGTGEAPGPWVVRKICCGSDDGTVEFPTWTEADNFREIYIDSARIAGHERSAIIRAKEAATGE